MLRTVVRQSLPEVDPSAFLGLVDGGEGREDGQGPRKMSSTPLRVCRYAGGGDGVAFGEIPSFIRSGARSAYICVHREGADALLLEKRGSI